MSAHVIGRIYAFRSLGAGEEVFDQKALVEVTDVRTDGFVELAFDMPSAPGKPRIYLCVPLSEIVRAAVISNPSKGEE